MAKKKLVVIGGGAAGFFCAANAARLNPSLEVVILEKTSAILQKVRVSGGGRCNVTHAFDDIDKMAAHYPRGRQFVRKAFHHFFVTDTIEWFQSRGVALKTEEDGRMFPVANTSQAIIDCLMKETVHHSVSLVLNTGVKQITPGIKGFRIDTTQQTISADFVMVAAGGFAKLSQFEWLTNLNLKIISPVPSIFTFNLPGHGLNKLMGITIHHTIVSVSEIKMESEGPLLITHWGLSGPSVLQLSAFAARELESASYKFTVQINWLPQNNEQSILELIRDRRSVTPAKKAVNGNFTTLPSRLWEYLLNESGIDENKRWADLTVSMMMALAKNICSYQLQAHGKTTFKEEFVSAGGIALSEIHHATMMSKKHNGLYFAGEIMDVDGVTGGYNFQHAWTSAFIAAKNIAAQ